MTGMCYTVSAEVNAGRFAFLRQPVTTSYPMIWAKRPPCADVPRPACSPQQRPAAHRGRFVMAKWNVGEKNGLWKGGRTITQHGYVLVRVGTDHHLADVRGYAYEHRLVAEEDLGRRLRPGEQVHHINGDTTDNRPENLKVAESYAHHRVYHRHNSNRRLPGSPNPITKCKCGCGQRFHKYDEWGRSRIYISGHNPMSSPLQDQIIRELQSGPKHRDEIARRCTKSVQVTASALSVLKRKGLATSDGHGIWRLTNDNKD
jgi:hypothetical protein